MGFEPINMPLIANVVSAPEKRVIPNTDKEVTELRVAVDHGYWDRQKQEEVKTGTTFFKVTCEGKLAQSVAETNYTPGTRVIIIGTYTSKEYDKKDGSKGMDQRIKAIDIGPSNLWAPLTLPERNGGGGQRQAPRQQSSGGYGGQSSGGYGSPAGGGDNWAPAYRGGGQPEADPWTTATPGGNSDPWA